jgi:hypothetical protein
MIKLANISSMPIKESTMSLQQRIMLQKKIYLIRVAFSLMALAQLVMNDSVCHQQAENRWGLIIIGLLYPHLGHVLFGRFDIDKKRGRIQFLLDSVFVGAVVGALDFALFPSMVLVVVNIFNLMLVGGGSLLGLGITLMITGALFTGLTSSPPLLEPVAVCPTIDWLASLILVGYFLVVAYIIHQHVIALRLTQAAYQARSNTAHTARILAEKALLSILPPSAAQHLSTNGKLTPEVVQDCALILIEFDVKDARELPLKMLGDAFQISETILMRHGLELVKTMGCRAIAFGRHDKGTDAALRALQEITCHIANDQSHAHSKQEHFSMNGIVHYGTVTLGMIQPDRMNIDLLGSSIDELYCFLEQSRSHSRRSAIFVSHDAYLNLSNTDDLTVAEGMVSPQILYTYDPSHSDFHAPSSI